MAAAYERPAKIKNNMRPVVIFCVFAFFIRNMSGNALCTDNMSVSDGHGNHGNIAYFIGFIDNRDG